MRSKHRYSSRVRSRKRAVSARQVRVRTVDSTYWRYHDFLHHWPGTEHGNDRAAAKAPTFESDGRALAGRRRANGGINHVSSPWDGSRVSGEGGRIFSVLVCPAHRVATERPWGWSNSDNAHIRTRRSL